MTENEPLPQILIIDDEIAICIAVKDLLSMYNYKVEYANNADEGMEFLIENPHTDAVLLDINLGSGINGVEALPIIKERFKYTQVIMFTSMTTIETGIECMKKGALDYITKPYDESELLKKIATALERKKIKQMNDLYLGIMVHDLKNPLQNIMGALEIVKYNLKDALTDQHKKYLESADAGVNQINIMINNILSVSKFENGTLSARREEFRLKEHLNKTLTMFTNEANNQGKSLQTNFPVDENFTIFTDREFFSQVLTNIVSNALRFTTQDGTVTVNLKTPESDDVQISVTNSGSYIEEEERDTIFDKFSSVKTRSNKVNSRNFGLGLTYCRMAVDAMDGKIWVEGDKDIPETTFHFTLKNRKET